MKMLRILSLLVLATGSWSYTDVHIVVFLSLHTVYNVTSYLPGASLAFKVANNRTDLLQGHRLMYTFRNVDCSALRAIRQVVETLEEETQFIMAIGADCSRSSRALAAVTQHYNLVQISPGSTDPALSRSTEYPLFLRTVPSDSFAASFITDVMRWFGWQRIAVLTEQDSLFTQTLELLESNIPEIQGQIIHQDQFSHHSNVTIHLSSLTDIVTRLLESHSSIVFLNMYQVNARDILCLVHRRGVSFPRFVWLINGWYSSRWWDGLTGTAHCSDDVIERMLERALIINHFPYLRDTTVVTDTGLSWQEFESQYAQEFGEVFGYDNNFTYSTSVGAFSFDAVWTALLALNTSLGQSTGEEMTLDNLTTFSYRQAGIGQLFFASAINTKFLGLTGMVEFDCHGDRSPDLRVMQYRFNGSSLSLVVTIVKEGDSLKFVEGESNATVYPGGVPADKTMWNIDLGLFVFCTIFSLFGMVLAIVFVVFNLIFRKHYCVKLSSPYVNVLIGIGGILLYFETIVFGVDQGVASPPVASAMCRLQVWVASFAFSLVFGSIFAKTLRIYYIFRNIETRVKKRKPVKDVHLFVIIGVLLLVDLIFLCVISALEDTRIHLEAKELPSEPGSVPLVIGVCVAELSAVWVSILLAYKGVLLVLGAFLAFETRKVKIPELNESIYIAVSIYTFFLISACLTLIGFLLTDMIHVRYALIGVFTNLGITTILCIVFVPKMYVVFKDPKGEEFSLNRPTTTTTVTLTQSNPNELQSEITRLRLLIEKVKTDQHVSAHLKTSQASIEVVSSGVDHNINVPVGHVDRTTPTEQAGRTTPSDEVDRTTPSDEVDRTTPSDEVDRTTPSDEVDRTTPSDEVDRTTPSDEVGKTTPSDEVGKATPLTEPPL